MINPFKRKKTAPASRATKVSFDEAIAIRCHFPSGEEFGLKEEREQIFDLEDELEKSMPERSVVDGHEFGGGHSNIYLYGPSADKLLAKVEHVLKDAPFARIDVTVRYGKVSDRNTPEKRLNIK